MIIFLYIVSLIIYYNCSFFSQKLQTHIRLGRKGAVPINYINHPKIYHAISIILFLLTAFIPIYFKEIYWAFVFISPILWFFASTRSRIKAIADFRKYILEMIEDKDEKTKKEMLKIIARTDTEILQDPYGSKLNRKI